MLSEPVGLPEQMSPVTLDAPGEGGIAPPPVADDDASEVFPQGLLQDLLSSALPDDDEGVRVGGEAPEPVPLAVDLLPGLVSVDHPRPPDPLPDGLVLGPEPLAHPSGNVQNSGRGHQEAVMGLQRLAHLL